MSRYLVMPSPAQLGTQHVTSGLVGYWDAGNSASYSGGTTWTDLSGNSRTGTLTNGPTFSADRGGKVVFDGTDDRVAVSGSLSVSSATFLAWVRRDGTQVSYAGLMASRNGLGGSPGDDVNAMTLLGTTHKLGYVWEAQPGTYDWDSGLVVPDNQWCMTAVAVSSSSAVAYLGTSSGVSSATNSVSHAATTINALDLGCDRVATNTLRSWKGDGAVFMLYNRALSASEITQNFNAFRGRFGL